MTEFWGSGRAAREAKISTVALLDAVKSGRLLVASKTESGFALFDPEEVQRFARERQNRLQRRSA